MVQWKDPTDFGAALIHGILNEDGSPRASQCTIVLKVRDLEDPETWSFKSTSLVPMEAQEDLKGFREKVELDGIEAVYGELARHMLKNLRDEK